MKCARGPSFLGPRSAARDYSERPSRSFDAGCPSEYALPDDDYYYEMVARAFEKYGINMTGAEMGQSREDHTLLED
jgi:hypothetical protein